MDYRPFLYCSDNHYDECVDTLVENNGYVPVPDHYYGCGRCHKREWFPHIFYDSNIISVRDLGSILGFIGFVPIDKCTWKRATEHDAEIVVLYQEALCLQCLCPNDIIHELIKKIQCILKASYPMKSFASRQYEINHNAIMTQFSNYKTKWLNQNWPIDPSTGKLRYGPDIFDDSHGSTNNLIAGSDRNTTSALVPVPRDSHNADDEGQTFDRAVE